ncbi:MAG: c-type cytochrome [Betaproteobacteria bacterium]|jgi:cytochrome c
MKKIILLIALSSICNLVSAADEPSPAALAGSNGCLICHNASQKLVGPSFKSIAEKYQGQADIQKTLVNKVRNGGAGSWGKIPMPAHPDSTEANLNIIVAWILKGSPAN